MTARKWVLTLVSGILLLVGVVYVASQVSPWPRALFFRYFFDRNAAQLSQALEKHVPPGIDSILNEQYRPDDKDAYLDVFYPSTLTNTDRALPTVVWVHGGGWISGNKRFIANYIKIIASHGYTVVGVGYSLAPEKQFPTPILQVNDALAYLQQHGKRLHIDVDRIVLAGSSAGAQIAAQVAAITTNPAHAEEMDVQPALQPGQLRSMVLSSGVYDVELVNFDGPFAAFIKTALWAYSGRKDALSDPMIELFSITNYVTADYPPTFITVGNDDPLAPHSIKLADRLGEAGVPIDTLFFADDHEPKLPHEYQYILDNEEGKQALIRIVDFLHNTTQ